MSVCPNCGGDHEENAWVAPKVLDRDITGIVRVILENGTLEDFALLTGTQQRAVTMLLRACQIIAHMSVMFAAMNGAEDPRAIAIESMKAALLEYANAEGQGGTSDTGQ